MAKIKNVSGEDRIVPGLNNRLVLAGAVVDVSDEDVYSYTVNGQWKAEDKAAEKAEAKARRDEAVRVAQHNNEPVPAPENPTEG